MPSASGPAPEWIYIIMALDRSRKMVVVSTQRIRLLGDGLRIRLLSFWDRAADCFWYGGETKPRRLTPLPQREKRLVQRV